jgi:hypothetical protein
MLIASLALGTACSQRDDEPAGKIPPPPAAASHAPAPTATHAPATRPTTTPHAATTTDPAAAAAGPELGAMHLDDATIEYQVAEPAPRRKGRSIELLLRSTPSGAVAAIDGQALGPTPALWQGEADGRAREFTFVLPGYASARYRFVPLQDGVVHGSLERLKLDPLDAGP